MESQAQQFRELRRLFFGRFLENDLIALDGDTRGALTGIFALLLAPGLFLPFFEFIRFSSYPLGFLAWQDRDLASLPDKALHLGLSMTVLGIVTVLEWDALLPDRRDYAVLRPLPIRIRTLFAAKLAALAQFWLLFTLLTSATAAVLFPMAVVQNGSLRDLLRFIGSHTLALLAGNAFMFCSMIAVQGLLLNALGWRRYRRWAPLAQSVLVTLLLVGFFFSLSVAFQLEEETALSALLRALPPLWFVGVYERALGWDYALFHLLAARAWLALGATALVSGCAYVLCYKRCIARSFEDTVDAQAPPCALARLLTRLCDGPLLRTPAERASFHFVRQMLAGSRGHRVLVAAYAGAGAALVFQALTGVIAQGSPGWWRTPAGPLLPAPLVLSLFLLSGLRYAFTVPAELQANWIFRLSDPALAGEHLRGVKKAVALTALAPLFGVLWAVYTPLWGVRLATLHILFAAVVAWLLLESLLVGFEKLPFTCSYVAGKANLKLSWPIYVLGYVAYVSVLSALEYWLLAAPRRFLWLLPAAALSLLALAWHARQRRLLGAPLLFDDQPEPAVQTLGLAQ